LVSITAHKNNNISESVKPPNWQDTANMQLNHIVGRLAIVIKAAEILKHACNNFS
jgi:hypothetical protein